MSCSASDSGGHWTVANTIGSRTTCVTCSPSAVSDAVTSQPMKPPPSTAAVFDSRARRRSSSESSSVRRWSIPGSSLGRAPIASTTVSAFTSSSDSTRSPRRRSTPSSAISASAGSASPRSSRFESGGRLYGPCGSCDQMTISSSPPAPRYPSTSFAAARPPPTIAIITPPWSASASVVPRSRPDGSRAGRAAARRPGRSARAGTGSPSRSSAIIAAPRAEPSATAETSTGRPSTSASVCSQRSFASRPAPVARTSSTPPIAAEDVGDAIHDALERGLRDVGRASSRTRDRRSARADPGSSRAIARRRGTAGTSARARATARRAARAASGRARRTGCRRPKAHRPGRSGARRAR